MKNVENKTNTPFGGVNSSETGKGQIGFDQLLSDSVDEVITEALGPKISSILWRQWSISHGINRENLSNHLPKLFESIRDVFGTGYRTVGELAIRRAYAKANLPLDYSSNRAPLEYAQELRQILADKTKTAEANK